jgi:hypothetical protein
MCAGLTWGGTNPLASRSTTSRPGGWGAHAGRRYREPSGCAILVLGNAPSKFQSVFPRGDSLYPLRSKLTTSRSSTDPRLYAPIPQPIIKLYGVVCIIQPHCAYKQNCEWTHKKNWNSVTPIGFAIGVPWNRAEASPQAPEQLEFLSRSPTAVSLAPRPYFTCVSDSIYINDTVWFD